MKRLASSLEILESRIAPASVAGHVVSYDDTDGNHVTVTFSKGDVDATLLNHFTFDASGHQLQEIDIHGIAAFTGGNLTVKVTRVSGGDGAAAIGYINATGINLGAVTIQGDLGAIDAGTDGTKPAVAGLTAASLGRFGLTTQGNAGDLESDIFGALGNVKIAGVVQGALISDTGAHAKIGTVTIGGSLAGTSTTGSGQIFSVGNIGLVKVGGDIAGNSGFHSGLIYSSAGKIAGVTVGGSLIGGSSQGAGQIVSALDLGPISIGGRVQGGFFSFTGSIASQNGKIASVTIGQSLIGSGAGNTGQISAAGDIGLVKIGGDVRGGNGLQTGFISSGGKIGALSIGHDLQGGTSNASNETGRVIAKSIGSVFVGGEVTGTGDAHSGVIEATAGSIGNVTVGGSVIGQNANVSGAIFTDAGNIGFVKIGHDVSGNGANRSGNIDATGGNVAGFFLGGSLNGGANGGGFLTAEGQVGPVTILGSVSGSGNNSGWIGGEDGLKAASISGNFTGGSGTESGKIFTDGGDLGPVKIGGFVKGGAGVDSGIIAVEGGLGSIASVSIGGDFIGGGNDFAGSITAPKNIGPVTIGGQMTAGSANHTAYIHSGGNIAAVTVVADVSGGAGSDSGQISAGGSLGPIKIGGNLAGGTGTSSGSVTAHGAIASVTIGGSLLGASALMTDVNNSAEIGSATRLGPVKIFGDIIAGNASGSHSILGNAEIDGPIVDSVFVGGSISSSFDSSSGTVDNDADITANKLGSLTVLGSLNGHTGSQGNTPVKIAIDLALGKISIVGSVTEALILGGYNSDFIADNANAQIGAVTVGGDWTASSLVAGVKNTTVVNFGDDNDSLIASPSTAKIASIVIGGVVLGTPFATNSTDFYGFSSHQIGSLKIGGVAIALPAPGNGESLSPSTGGDVAVRVS